MLIVGFALYFVQTSRDTERYALFVSLGRGRAYRATLFGALLALMTPLVVVFGVAGALYGQAATSAACALVMLLFEATQLSCLIMARTCLEKMRLARPVTLLVAGPIVVIAWILALAASTAWCQATPTALPMLGLGVCCVWSLTMWSCRR